LLAHPLCARLPPGPDHRTPSSGLELSSWCCFWPVGRDCAKFFYTARTRTPRYPVPILSLRNFVPTPCGRNVVERLFALGATRSYPSFHSLVAPSCCTAEGLTSSPERHRKTQTVTPPGFFFFFCLFGSSAYRLSDAIHFSCTPLPHSLRNYHCSPSCLYS